MLGGHAAPPMVTFFTLESRLLYFFACASRASHTVGTPSRLVTLSASMRSSRLRPSSPGPGSTSFEPTLTTEYGTHHAMTGNNRTTASETTEEESKNTSD